MKSRYIVLGPKCCLVTAVVLGLLVWNVGAKRLTPNLRLVQAAGYGDLAWVKAELDKGADVNAKSHGSTALTFAVQAGHVAIAKFLLSKGADVSIRGRGGATALLIACRQQDSLLLMKLLLEKGADPNTIAADGVTALKTAMDNGQPEMVKCLLDSGADVNARLKDGSTALMWASLTGNEDFVQLLIAKGADVNAKAGNGSTALAWAAIMERNDLAKLLVVSCAQMTLPIAAALGDKKAAEWLIHLGADVNRKDEYGQTPLMNARERGHQDIVELLKERGASQ